MRSRGAVVGVVVALGWALHCGQYDTEENDNFRENVMQCEDALAHLGNCCPGFDTSAPSCRNHYHEDTSTSCNGISSTTHYEEVNEQPALNLDESKCIRSRSCDDLKQNKICERAQAARPYRQGRQGSSPDAAAPFNETHPAVCP
jgi:hypothetical protein